MYGDRRVLGTRGSVRGNGGGVRRWGVPVVQLCFDLVDKSFGPLSPNDDLYIGVSGVSDGTG